jgi:hypothetical protein
VSVLVLSEWRVVTLYVKNQGIGGPESGPPNLEFISLLIVSLRIELSLVVPGDRL